MSGTHGSHPAEAVGFGFKRMVLDNRYTVAERIRHSSHPLLDNVRKLVPEKELSVGRVGIVLPGREVNIGAPGEGDCSDGRSLGTDVDADVGEVRAERGFHLGLNIARQGPSAGLGAKIDLERLDAGAALEGGFLLDDLRAACAWVHCGKGKGPDDKDPLDDLAPAA